MADGNQTTDRLVNHQHIKLADQVHDLEIAFDFQLILLPSNPPNFFYDKRYSRTSGEEKNHTARRFLMSFGKEVIIFPARERSTRSVISNIREGTSTSPAGNR